MRPLTEIEGLKYPDEYVTRHFFKAVHPCAPGHVLELGSGTGNNLMLYRQYGWEVTGVDNDPDALASARQNLLHEMDNTLCDLSCDLPDVTGPFDVLLMPGVLCYTPPDQARRLFAHLRPMLSPNAHVMVRVRMVDDYRYGRGIEVGPDRFELGLDHTGELGTFNQFYTQAGLVALLDEGFGLTDRVELTCRFDNLQSGRIVRGNSDMIVWGRVGS